MALRTATDVEALRLRIILAGILVSFAVLATLLWRLQVKYGHQYAHKGMKQSVRRVRTPGVRGLIYDRTGVALAENRPSYCLALYLEELRQDGSWTKTVDRAEETLDRMAEALGLPREVSRDDIWTHIKRRLPLPLTAWKELDSVMMARWAERGSGIPGTGILVEPIRVYPGGTLASHALGYVGRADPPDEDEPYDYYVPEMTGRNGIEKLMDDSLTGAAGGYLVRVDVAGFKYMDSALESLRRHPEKGDSVVLAIDREIQAAAERSLGSEAGAVVVMDPSNGDILALASAPSYDPNLFVPGISGVDYDALIQDPARPLWNRVTQGAYAPGSVFKLVVALAALENNRAEPADVYSCPGYFDLGRARFRCWYRHGHGPVTMREAIKYSCNVYFYQLGLKCGHEFIYHQARAMGLGAKTGIELLNERSGLVPNDGWKRRRYQDAWRDGDTCNLSIGQGALIVTPVQMAVLASTLANRGTVYKPRLLLQTVDGESGAIDRNPVKIVNEMNWSERSLATVLGGMRDVVMEADGTGKKARVPGFELAAKTGTVEYGKKEEGNKRGWMIAFAPFEEPHYAVAMVIDDAVSGGTTVGPKMGALLEYLLLEYGGKGGGS